MTCRWIYARGKALWHRQGMIGGVREKSTRKLPEMHPLTDFPPYKILMEVNTSRTRISHIWIITGRKSYSTFQKKRKKKYSKSDKRERTRARNSRDSYPEIMEPKQQPINWKTQQNTTRKHSVLKNFETEWRALLYPTYYRYIYALKYILHLILQRIYGKFIHAFWWLKCSFFSVNQWRIIRHCAIALVGNQQQKHFHLPLIELFKCA